MKKILLNLGTLAVVAVAVVGGTIAFYNDTETSSGNIFVAGSIDLKVDHLKQTYNGVDCATCSVNIWSSTATEVIGGTGAYAGGYPANAVELSFIHAAWIDSIPGSSAKWIWVTDPVLLADTTNDAEYTFQKKFDWNGSLSGITLDLALVADNGYKIVFNGTTVADVLGGEFNYGALLDTSAAEALMLPEVQNGENTLEITVRNKAGISDPAINPAGLIFDLTIERPEGECLSDSSFQQVCRLWTEKDLDQSDTFFNFGDVKPGDFGTNVVSLHVSSNDAYACLVVGDKDDQENPAQPLDPELDAGDALGLGNPTGHGELSNFLNVFTWDDANGDGAYDVGETSLGSVGPLASLNSIMSMDPGNGQFLTATTTQNVGLAWCAGTLVPNQGGAFDCDGSGMGNIAQSDSFAASLTAYTEQVRNNSDFSCASVDLGTDED